MVELPDLKEYEKRFNAQKVFLTYPNLTKGFTPAKLVNKISEKAGVKYYLVSQEKHKSGKYHLHGYFEFYKKLDVDIANYFNVLHYGWRHPNVQKPKSLPKLWRYIKKDGNFITNLPNNGEPLFEQITDIEDDTEFWREILYNMKTNLSSTGYLRALEQLRKSKLQYLADTYSDVKSGKLTLEEYYHYKNQKGKY